MKTFATLTAASLLALAGAAAVAQPAPQSPPGAPPAAPGAVPVPPPEDRGRGLNRAQYDALTDARIAGIQAGLKLNAEQQRLWGPVEQALRARAAERAERFEERRRERLGREAQPAPADITQRFERQAQRATQNAQQATERAQRLTALSEAVKPFYASLDDNQKRLLPLLMREGGDRDGRMHRHHGGRMEGRMGAAGRYHDGSRGMMGRGGMHHDGGRGMMGREGMHHDGGRGMMGREGMHHDGGRGMMGRGGMMEYRGMDEGPRR